MKSEKKNNKREIATKALAIEVENQVLVLQSHPKILLKILRPKLVNLQKLLCR